MGQALGAGSTEGVRLAELGEDALLAHILPLLTSAAAGGVLIGPGDDTALVQTAGSVLATTDALVRGRDWLDEWSTGADVGAKAVAQNVADIAAMGGTATALLVTLVADPQMRLAWALDLASGLAAAARDAAVPVVGGDLSSAPAGVVVVSVTALGTLGGRAPVCRSGAREGDVVAVAGGLGRSAAGLLLLQAGRSGERADLVGYHRRPRPPYEQGPVAALAGATAMIDVSDGLVRDGARVARASGVSLALEWAPLGDLAAALGPALTPAQARACVLGGGEEHSLLACFPPGARLPSGWQVIGAVADRDSNAAGARGVTVDGQLPGNLGWDHFGG